MHFLHYDWVDGDMKIFKSGKNVTAVAIDRALPTEHKKGGSHLPLQVRFAGPMPDLQFTSIRWFVELNPPRPDGTSAII
jgi:hypothetical protein